METIAQTTYDFKAKATETIFGAKRRYLDDLNAMSEEQITKCPGGCARTPADFTYEIVVINRRTPSACAAKTRAHSSSRAG